MRNIICLILVVFAGCSTSKLIVQSLPAGATVTVMDEAGKIRSLGQTPLSVELSDVFRSGTSFSEIQIIKDDYSAETILLSKSSLPTNYEVSLNLKKNQQDLKSVDILQKNESIAQKIAQANNLMNQKRYEEAEQIVSKFVLDYPNISVGYDYMGNIQYLKKDLKRALFYYEKGLHINPDNLETKEMVSKLKSIFN